MKRCELTREAKRELWKRFDDGAQPTGMVLDGLRVPDDAAAKQHELWTAYTIKYPKKKKIA